MMSFPISPLKTKSPLRAYDILGLYNNYRILATSWQDIAMLWRCGGEFKYAKSLTFRDIFPQSIQVPGIPPGSR